jgi:hypothetical protein
MATEELIKWMKDSLSKGFSKEQLSQKLIQTGYDEKTITDLFNQIEASQNISSQPTLEVKKSNWFLNISLSLLFVGLVIGAMLFFSSGNEALLMEDEDLFQTVETLNDCYNFSSNLKSCSPYDCEFKHLVTGETLSREIVGIQNESCIYSEQMLNNLTMTCEWNVSELNLIANDFENMPPTQVLILLNTTNYLINGSEQNLIQESLASGECIVS